MGSGLPGDARRGPIKTATEIGMKLVSRLTAIASFLVLASCGTFTAESYLSDPLPAGDSFNTCLAREYQDRANSEAYVDCNWVDSAQIIEKSKAAASGQTVLPYDPALVGGILPADVAPLQDARSQLLAALDNGGRTDRGCACAKAQRYYDGWVEQSRDNKLGVNGYWLGGDGGPVQPDRVSAEKAAFFEALTQCQAPKIAATPEPQVGPWTIYFGFDKYNLTAEAKAVISEIVSTAKAPLNVVGHTDTVGSSAYNNALGLRRANAVSSDLKANGATVCDTSSKGKTDLAVPTADGVKEPLNRRSVVTLCN